MQFRRIHEFTPLVRTARDDADRPGRFGNDLVEEEGGECPGNGGPDEPATGLEGAEAVGEEGLRCCGCGVDVFDDFEEGYHVELGVGDGAGGGCGFGGR